MPAISADLHDLRAQVCAIPAQLVHGKVVAVRSGVVIAEIPDATLGSICSITTTSHKQVLARVVAFDRMGATLAPYDDLSSISVSARITVLQGGITLHQSALRPGAVIDCLGRSLSCDNGYVWRNDGWSICRKPPDPLSRQSIASQLITGVPALDALLPIGYGQRIGLFAGAGVGKSTLLARLTKDAAVDHTVIALVGERGREVREFIEESLTEEARARATVVVATSDESAARRVLAVETATAVAEFHRAQGKRVLLLVDSLTRVARGIREMTLAAGELPIRQGYTPSVYMQLPRLVERAGNSATGSITAIYTVLTAGEGESDPLGEEMRSLLDGHFVLESSLAERGVRPAIDYPASVSRLAPRLLLNDAQRDVRKIIAALARLKRDRDLSLFGGSSDAELAHLIQIQPEIDVLLSQANAESPVVWRAQLLRLLQVN